MLTVYLIWIIDSLQTNST